MYAEILVTSLIVIPLLKIMPIYSLETVKAKKKGAFIGDLIVLAILGISWFILLRDSDSLANGLSFSYPLLPSVGVSFSFKLSIRALIFITTLMILYYVFLLFLDVPNSRSMFICYSLIQSSTITLILTHNIIFALLALEFLFFSTFFLLFKLKKELKGLSEAFLIITQFSFVFLVFGYILAFWEMKQALSYYTIEDIIEGLRQQSPSLLSFSLITIGWIFILPVFPFYHWLNIINSEERGFGVYITNITFFPTTVFAFYRFYFTTFYNIVINNQLFNSFAIIFIILSAIILQLNFYGKNDLKVIFSNFIILQLNFVLLGLLLLSTTDNNICFGFLLYVPIISGIQNLFVEKLQEQFGTTDYILLKGLKTCLPESKFSVSTVFGIIFIPEMFLLLPQFICYIEFYKAFIFHYGVAIVLLIFLIVTRFIYVSKAIHICYFISSDKQSDVIRVLADEKKRLSVFIFALEFIFLVFLIAIFLSHTLFAYLSLAVGGVG